MVVVDCGNVDEMSVKKALTESIKGSNFIFLYIEMRYQKTSRVRYLQRFSNWFVRFINRDFVRQQFARIWHKVSISSLFLHDIFPITDMIIAFQENFLRILAKCSKYSRNTLDIFMTFGVWQSFVDHVRRCLSRDKLRANNCERLERESGRAVVTNLDQVVITGTEAQCLIATFHPSSFPLSFSACTYPIITSLFFSRRTLISLEWDEKAFASDSKALQWCLYNHRCAEIRCGCNLLLGACSSRSPNYFSVFLSRSRAALMRHL